MPAWPVQAPSAAATAAGAGLASEYDTVRSPVPSSNVTASPSTGVTLSTCTDELNR